MDSRPQNNPPPAPRHVDNQAAAAPPAPSKPKLLEVNLLRKYAPHFLVQEDGTCLENNNNNTKVLEPGIMKLHHEDAAIVLEAAVALPTRATFKDS